jgi:hypothetical protein
MTLVERLVAFLGRYVVMREEQKLIDALWVVHTYCLDAFEQTPYLTVTSPEKQCGKSRLLEVLEVLVNRPWQAVLPSEAVAYRHIDFAVPTLLLDEVDTIFNPKTADRHEGLRALLNAGHRRGSRVPRCVGTSENIEEFSVFCPKVLAGIGALPDTIADRSIPIRLERKTKSEKVDRFLIRQVTADAAALKEEMQTFAQAHADDLDHNYPEMPEALSDRMQEGTECLGAIADLLECGEEARSALVTLLTEERLDSHETMRERLLRDLHEVYEQHLDGQSGLHTDTVLSHLRRMEESPWSSGHYYGRRLEAKDLASLLKHYGVKSTTVRIGGEVAKGYKRDDLYTVWERYLPDLITDNSSES